MYMFEEYMVKLDNLQICNFQNAEDIALLTDTDHGLSDIILNNSGDIGVHGGGTYVFRYDHICPLPSNRDQIVLLLRNSIVGLKTILPGT